MKIKSKKSHHIFVAFLFSTVFGSYNILQCQDISQSLVGYWSMECNASDQSGNKNDGKAIKSPICTTGKIDSAFTFDGFSQYIQLPKDSSRKFYDTNGFTWSLWFQGFNLPKTNTIRPRQTLISMMDSVLREDITLSFGDLSNEEKYLVFTVDGIGGVGGLTFPNPRYQPAGGFKDSTWYNVIATCDYSKNEMVLYVNGVEVDRVIAVKKITPISRNMTASIGAAFDVFPNALFNGKIDEVRIYSRVIDASEIKLLANQIKNYLIPDTTTLNFGNILCETVAKRYFVLTNTGSDNFSVTGATNKNTPIFKILDSKAINLSGGQAYQLDILFTPPSLGKYFDTVFVYNSNGALPLKLFVSASKEIPSISQSDTLDFNEIVICKNDTSVTNPYKMINTDVIEGIAITDIKSSNSAYSWNIKKGDTLKYNKAYNSLITVHPSGIGDYNGEITLVLGDCGFEKKIYIRAKATDVVAKMPSEVDFGNRILGFKYDTTIYVINRSSRTYTITKVSSPQPPFSMDAINPADLGLKNIGDTLKINLHYTAIDGNQNSSITVTIQSPCGDKDIVMPIKARGRYLAEFNVSIPNIEAKTGDRIQIPINITQTKNFINSLVDSIKFTLKYNNSDLIPKSLLASKLSQDTSFINLSYAVKKIDGDQSFIIDNFDVALGEVEIDSLIIQNFQVTGGFAQATISNGSVKLTNICKENGTRYFSDDTPSSLFNVSPNPISTVLAFEFNAIEDGNYIIKLINSNGIFTNNLFDNYLKRGQYKFNFDLPNLGSGLYFLNITSPSNNFNKKVQVVK